MARDWGDGSCPDGYWPFDKVTLTREKDASGTPTGWYTILGEREGGERSVRIEAAELLRLADAHIKITHGVSPAEGITGDLYQHALMRVAVALLID